MRYRQDIELKLGNSMSDISVDYINQGKKDYLGAEIAINKHIVCLLAITDDLDLSLVFFRETIESEGNEFYANYQQFIKVLSECETELKQVIINYQSIKF